MREEKNGGQKWLEDDHCQVNIIIDIVVIHTQELTTQLPISSTETAIIHIPHTS
jgi:hypothetical protein